MLPENPTPAVIFSQQHDTVSTYMWQTVLMLLTIWMGRASHSQTSCANSHVFFKDCSSIKLQQAKQYMKV